MSKIKQIAVLTVLLLSAFPLFLTGAGAESDDLGWYKDAVVYEVFVRSFHDSNGDGKGDLKGLIGKLDYLNDGKPGTGSDLEVTALWLMPVFSSPSYHGYDVTDYYNINKDYGTNEDMELLLKEAHKRGIRIILDYVINHTSNRHPYFKEAMADRKSPKRNWFVWSKDLPPGWSQPWSPGGPSTQVWHKTGTGYYYGVFYYGMPDWNWTNPEVRKELKTVSSFWLKKGVDGFRLDAIRYLVEEGGNLGQKDTAGTHKAMAELYSHSKQVKKDVLFVGEVWADMDTVATYFKSPQSPAQVDSCFNFDLAGAIVDGVKNHTFNKMNAVLEIALETYPKGAIDSIFLTNHDQDRIASVIGPKVPKLKLAASILLTFPGVPYIYYGEEIAMSGRKPDEMIRRPMRWDSTEMAGFTTAKRPWIRPEPRPKAFNVADMDKKKNSLLKHYKTFIRLRNGNIALRRGNYKWVEATHPKVFAFLRQHKEQNLLVLHNFSPLPVEKVNVKETITRGKNILTGKSETTIQLNPYETKIFTVKVKH